MVLEVNEVSKSYEKKQILKEISFSIQRGEILGILGYSGAGKSTLLNIITGLISPDSGYVTYICNNNKQNAIHTSHIAKEMLGYSTQEPSFYEELSVEENLVFYGKLMKIEDRVLKKTITMLLKLFDLTHAKNRLGQNLSVGMKKRLDLACSLIHGPEILILDEPTANLDFKLKDEILSYVKEINQLGVSVIYVSHFLEEIEYLSDRVLLIGKGRYKIVENKTLKSIYLRFLDDGRN